MQPTATVHKRAAVDGTGKFNELCLEEKYWLPFAHGFRLRDDWDEVNCKSCLAHRPSSQGPDIAAGGGIRSALRAER